LPLRVVFQIAGGISGNFAQVYLYGIPDRSVPPFVFDLLEDRGVPLWRPWGVAIRRTAAYSRAGALREGAGVPYQRQAEVVLASLRGIERELESTEPHSPEAEFLGSTAARLRNEYQQLIEQARASGRPVPPPLRDGGG
jgi:hypothetical protein